MKSYSSREVIRILKENCWYEVSIEGSHHQFKNPTKKGRTTVKHPNRDILVKHWTVLNGYSGIFFFTDSFSLHHH